jgi:hypothetical protein
MGAGEYVPLETAHRRHIERQQTGVAFYEAKARRRRTEAKAFLTCVLIAAAKAA